MSGSTPSQSKLSTGSTVSHPPPHQLLPPLKLSRRAWKRWWEHCQCKDDRLGHPDIQFIPSLGDAHVVWMDVFLLIIHTGIAWTSPSIPRFFFMGAGVRSRNVVAYMHASYGALHMPSWAACMDIIVENENKGRTRFVVLVSLFFRLQLETKVWLLYFKTKDEHFLLS